MNKSTTANKVAIVGRKFKVQQLFFGSTFVLRLPHHRKAPKRRITIIAVSLIVLSLSSCISRLSRPEITGTVVDYAKKPVGGCKVGEVITDKNGSFTLPEKRYNAFIITELIVMEAPPVMVVERIEKNGFEKDAISIFSAHGGGQRKGAKYTTDTIFLKRFNQQFDISTLLKNSKWKLSYTKNADTLYLIKDGFKKWCKTERCSPFYDKYEVLTDNYYHTQAKNLPEGMIRRLIDIQFKEKKSILQIKAVKQYKSTFDEPNKETDTLNTSGSWELVNNNMIKLNINAMHQISGTFKLSEIDLYQLKLTK